MVKKAKNSKREQITDACLKINQIILNWIQIIFGFDMCVILAVLFFSQKEYRCQKEFLIQNRNMFMIIGMIVLVCVTLCHFWGERRSEHKEPKKYDKTDIHILFSTIVLFFWQCYFTYNIFFLSGWDAGYVRQSAQSIASGKLQIPVNYFSTYPNNLFITYLYATILKFSNSIKVFGTEYSMLAIVFFNCFINSVACFLTYKTAAIFVKKNVAVFAYFLSILAVGFSSWSAVCYSDSLVLCIPIFTLYLFIGPWKKEKTRFICKGLAISVSMLGYFIKPQCAIVLLAILLIEIINMLRNFRRQKIMDIVTLFVIACLTFFCINCFMSWKSEKIGLVLDENKTFGVSHFLMMGMNEEDEGAYSGDDVSFSESFQTVKERTEANLSVTKQRIQKMGVLGLASHLHNKILITFNDGTFAWGEEGVFYTHIFEDTNNISPILKSIYYNEGENYLYLATAQHFVWITCLLFTFISIFVDKNNRQNSQLVILWIVILGLILYELLFEVRARYVYIFVPVFCVLAAKGIENVIHVARKR